MKQAGQNDNNDELKRKRRSLLSKITRREIAVLFARNELRNLETELRIVEEMIAERKGK